MKITIESEQEIESLSIVFRPGGMNTGEMTVFGAGKSNPAWTDKQPIQEFNSIVKNTYVGVTEIDYDTHNREESVDDTFASTEL